ncbi:MAG: DUF1015 domain-containing protein [Eubacterium sp.]|nr:DUF1015 domain-containing protein [Eubacterium sp.]
MNNIFQATDIILPGEKTDPGKWAVVACDQFTSQPEYWNAVEEIVGDSPSTYRLILPEIFLEDEDVDDRLRKINESMHQYEKDGIFRTCQDAMIYVERRDSEGKIRCGIVGAFDLEAYDYHKGSTTLIRATEATMESRIPPRLQVRENALVELPHILILMDDPNKSVIEPLASLKNEMEMIYDFDLMLGGGHINGYLIPEDQQNKILKALERLTYPEHFVNKYGLKDTPVLAYAVGDGNHSFATAKAYYEQLKAENPDQDLSNHPARYCLAELINLHSPALEFEAINRIITEVDTEALIGEMTKSLALSPRETACGQSFQIVVQGRSKTVWIGKATSKLTIGTVQHFLDRYVAEHGGRMDYIHGNDTVRTLSMKEGSVGLLLPEMEKEDLFPTVILDGALPRKTFSMGHAQDKRYYLECRKIR